MRLILFLGAGVSIPSGLPDARALTKRILKGPPHATGDGDRVRVLLDVLRKHDTNDISRVGAVSDGSASGAIYRGTSTYEDLFFLCQQIALWNIGLSDNSMTTPFMEVIERKARTLLRGRTVAARLRDLASMGRLGCSLIETIVSGTLQRKYRAGFDLIRQLATDRRVDQLNIVTLNHDTLVEQFLSANKLPFIDGFGGRDGDVRWYEDDVYDAPGARIRLFKLHGSIDWYSFLYGGRSRTAIFLGRDPTRAKDQGLKPLMVEFGRPSFLSGVNKAVAYQRGLFADIHFHFGELLRRCDRILMSGYGWGDTIVNFQLDTWFDRVRSNRLLLLHRHSNELRNNSLIMASGYDAWVQSGQLVCIARWLCEASLGHVEEYLFAGPQEAP